MSIISKQQKSSNGVKNTIKKISKFIVSRMFYLLIGLFLAIAFSAVYAAWNSTVSSGDTLTAVGWNEHVNKLIELDNRIQFSSCSWNTTTVYHAVTGSWDTVICPADCVVRGIRTTENPGLNEQHQIYCCCY